MLKHSDEQIVHKTINLYEALSFTYILPLIPKSKNINYNLRNVSCFRPKILTEHFRNSFRNRLDYPHENHQIILISLRKPSKLMFYYSKNSSNNSRHTQVELLLWMESVENDNSNKNTLARAALA